MTFFFFWKIFMTLRLLLWRKHLKLVRRRISANYLRTNLRNWKKSYMDSAQNTAAVGGNNGIINAQGNNNNNNSSNNDGTISDDAKQNLSDVTNSIDKTLGLLHQLYLTVSSFNVASQLPLLQRMYSLSPKTLISFNSSLLEQFVFSEELGFLLFVQKFFGDGAW